VGEDCDLVLTGLQSDDYGSAQTGVILAERLGRPHATIVMEVQVTGGELRAKRELEAGWFQWVAMPLPAVLTIQSGIKPLRYATLKGILAAKKKEIRTVPPARTDGRRMTVRALRVPDRAKRAEIIEGPPAAAAAELVRRLREEARVIP
jgi:electron transfer flavoprotein beta subunit